MSTQSRNIKLWIDQLNEGVCSDSTIIDILMRIRPLSKQDSGIKDIENNGGVETFLKLIQRPNRRMLDISISILANCSTKQYVQTKVVKCKGIPAIVKLLQTIKNVTIVTRTCRALANLANDPDGAKMIFDVGAVELIIKLLKQSSDSQSLDCVSSGLRALRNLATTPKYRRRLIQHGVVAATTKRLRSESRTIVCEAVRLLAAVSKTCTLEFADHMLASEAKAIKRLVDIVEGDFADDSHERTSALTVLINLTLQGCARPAIGNAEGLNSFVNELEEILLTDYLDNLEGPLPESSFQLVGAICYCCREAINRAKLRSLGALPHFVKMLSDDIWSSVHPFILTTLLCFVFDEEGLKILQDNGLFLVLLQTLKKYTEIEQSKSGDDKTDESSSRTDTRWEIAEKDFDRRHSLSCDLPTRFNQRSLVNEDDSDDAESLFFNEMTDFEFHWRNVNYQTPHTPQWSPLGPSPISDELRLADEITPPDSPGPWAPLPDADKDEQDPHESFLNDQDGSSSSRDGFDQMHSPALLPFSNPFSFASGEIPNTAKRERGGSSGSNSSDENLHIMGQENAEFNSKMAKDLRQVPKRAKLENLRDSDRIRSWSLDTESAARSATAPINIPAGPSSPPPEVTLPDLGNAACSPSFLQFVNETCSVPPLLLKHAGRDVASSSDNSCSSTSASSWKQTRRRMPGYAARRLDEVVSGILNESNEPSTSTENILPILTKAVSNPLPVTLDSSTTSTENKTDCALSGPDPVTPVQIILRLLCHYCEMSNEYIASLAQQDDITSYLVSYIEKHPEPLDSKIHRVIDRLSSCVDCFPNIVTRFLLPCVDAASRTRMLCTKQMEKEQFEVFCDECNIRTTSECNHLLDNMWHNVAIALSSMYCTTSLARMITKGTDLEATAATCTSLLLTFWCANSKQRMENMSESLRKHISSNLKLIAENKRLKLLCDVIFKYDSESVIYQSVAYTLHKVASYSVKYLKSDKYSKKEEDSLFANNAEINQPAKSEGLFSLFSKSASEIIDPEGPHKAQSMCQYVQQCNKSQPEKILVFQRECDPSYNKSDKQQCRTRSKSSKLEIQTNDVDNLIPVHVDILSKESPMFEAMLSGKYRESSETTIEIQDISYHAALYIIHNIYGCIEENCASMKGIWLETTRSPGTQYNAFCSCKNQTEQGEKYPAEIEIMKVMDQWLLDSNRRDFFMKHLEYFSKWYIDKEFSVALSKLENDSSPLPMTVIEGDDENPLELETKESEKKTLNLHGNSNCQHLPFWEFAYNHNFKDITDTYTENIFSPCFFQHNHLTQNKLFISLFNNNSGDSTFSDLSQNILDETLKYLITAFKKR